MASFGHNLIVLELCPEFIRELKELKVELIDLLRALFLLSETEFALRKLIRESVRGETKESGD